LSCARDLQREVERRAQRQLPDAPEPRREALALEVLHDDVGRAVRQRPVVVRLDDVRVPDGVRRARLLKEAAHDLGVGRVLRVQHLDGRLAPEARMLREIHDAHPALAELRRDSVVPDGRAEQGGRL
jgi:hypothetical protein